MAEQSQPLMPCGEAIRQLWDYLDGAATDQTGVAAHLAFCRRCCGELEFVEHLRAVLESQSADELPLEAIERLEHFVEGL